MPGGMATGTCHTASAEDSEHSWSAAGPCAVTSPSRSTPSLVPWQGRPAGASGMHLRAVRQLQRLLAPVAAAGAVAGAVAVLCAHVSLRRPGFPAHGVGSADRAAIWDLREARGRCLIAWRFGVGQRAGSQSRCGDAAGSSRRLPAGRRPLKVWSHFRSALVALSAGLHAGGLRLALAHCSGKSPDPQAVAVRACGLRLRPPWAGRWRVRLVRVRAGGA